MRLWIEKLSKISKERCENKSRDYLIEQINNL